MLTDKHLIGSFAKHLKQINLEAFIWIVALIYFMLINPYQPKHLDFCVFSLVGVENCPGCGLGKSISLLFHGEIIASFNSHPLGIPAVVLIIRRIIHLLKTKTNPFINNMETKNG